MLELDQRDGPIGRHGRNVTLSGEEVAEHLPNVLVVVDDQYPMTMHTAPPSVSTHASGVPQAEGGTGSRTTATNPSPNTCAALAKSRSIEGWGR